LHVLQRDAVEYDRQPVALVVADTFARAKNAASLVRVTYAPAPPRTRFDQGEIYTPKAIHGEPSQYARGDAGAALQTSAVRVDAVYTTPVEHHNPMEPHATIAMWDGGKLKVYDSTQGARAFRGRVRPSARQRAGDRFVHRRRLRHEGLHLGALDPRRDGGEGRRPAGTARDVAPADVGRCRLPARDPPARRARSES
jgi:hypothetical protein